MIKFIYSIIFNTLNILNITFSEVYYMFSKKKNLKSLKQKLKNGEIKRVYVNRTDRIGDAIITLPVLLALKKQIKDIEIITLTSDYNNWVLHPFIKTQIIKSVQHDKRTISEVIRSILNDLFEKSKSTPKTNEVLLIDLKGDKFQSKLFKFHYVLGFKTLLLNWKHQDFIYDDFYVNGSDKQITKKYVEMFEDLFDVNLDVQDAPEELRTLVTRNATNKAIQLSNGKYMILYVGNKSFRNFSVRKWEDIINSIYYEGMIYIIDDPDKKIINGFEYIRGRNVKIINDDLSLNDLCYLASKSDLVVGIDGGGFNYMNILANSFQIQSTCHNASWKQYTNKNTRLVKRHYSVNSIHKLSSELMQIDGFMNKHTNIYEVIISINKTILEVETR